MKATAQPVRRTCDNAVRPLVAWVKLLIKFHKPPAVTRGVQHQRAADLLTLLPLLPLDEHSGLPVCVLHTVNLAGDECDT